MDDFISGTLDDAVAKLAEFAAFTRTGSEKVAAGDFLSSLGSAVRDNPALSHALVGGGLGAAALGANTALSNRGKDPDQKRSILGSIATGGLLGAGAGAGVGAARQGASKLNTGGGISGTDAMRPGQFIDPTTGRRMQIDPKALQENPDLHSQVRALTTPTAQGALAGTVGGALDAIRERMPTASRYMPWVAGLDAALHTPGVGLAHATPETAGGYYGRKWLAAGAGESKNLTDTLKKTLFDNKAPGVNGASLPDHSPPGPASTRAGRVLQRIRDRMRTGTEGVTDILGRKAGPGTGDAAALRLESPVTREVEHTSFPLARDADGNPVPDRSSPSKFKTQEPVLDDAGRPTMRREDLSRGTVGHLKALGAGKDEVFKDRGMFRVPGTNRMYPGFRTWGGAAGARVGAYSLPFLTEYMVRGLQEDSANRQSIRDIVARHTKEVPEGR